MTVAMAIMAASVTSVIAISVATVVVAVVTTSSSATTTVVHAGLKSLEVHFSILANPWLVGIRADDVVVIIFVRPKMRTAAPEAFGFVARTIRTGVMPSFVVAILREGALGDACKR